MEELTLPTPRLSVTIATCNRIEELCRCVLSLASLAPLDFEVLVLDDGSQKPVEPFLTTQLSADFPVSVKIIRREESKGTISARNELAASARAEFILSLDDDAYLLSATAILSAFDVLTRDTNLGSIAFPQRDQSGELRGDGQPARVDYPCYCPTFYGYATLIRRSALLEVGGYRELWYQEEAECCKRLANNGYYCVYWPEAQIAHVPSPRNRERSFPEFRAKNQLWNRCQDAIYNEPLPLMLFTLSATVIRSAAAKRTWHLPMSSEIGPRWLLGKIRREIPSLWRYRSPLKYHVFLYWRWIKWRAPKYDPQN